MAAKRLLWVASLSIVLGGACREESAYCRPKEEVPAREVLARQVAWDNCLKDAESVVKRFNEARPVISFLKEEGVLAAPSKIASVVMVGHSTPKTQFVIVPLLKGDESRGKLWRMYISQRAGALFVADPEHCHLVVDNEPMSPTTRGITLLREGKNGLVYVRSNKQADPIECAVKAREFQHALMRQIGGIQFARIMEKEKARLLSLIQKENRGIGSLFPAAGGYYREYDQVFGPSRSAAERDLRQTDGWIQAHFELLDEYLPKDKANQRKLAFLTRLYDIAEQRSRE